MNQSIKIPTSPYPDYCYGFGNPGNHGDGYIVGFILGIGKSTVSNQDNASLNLDEIDAFDKAEVEGTMLGQINMITVSSFCGPMGYLWGYDLATHPDLYQQPMYGNATVSINEREIPVYSLKPMMQATKELFGTVAAKRFPLIPGAHVPCAKKSISMVGPKYIYCSLAIGIPEDRSQNACLLMEDVGVVENDLPNTQSQLFNQLTKSIADIGKNQQVIYKEIFADIKFGYVDKGEVGCALVAAPYFTLAKSALLKAGTPCRQN